MPTNLKRTYNRFAGENLRSPELLRDEATSTQSINTIQTDNLGMSKRPGNQIHVAGQGGSGAVTFNNFAVGSGITTRERLVVDQNLYREKEDTITISYSGTGQAAFSFLLNSDQVFELKLFVDGEVVANQTFGNGKTTSEVGTSAIVSFINGVTNFYSHEGGSGSNRAAYALVREYTLIKTVDNTFADLASFPPAILNSNKTFVALDTDITYRAISGNWVSFDFIIGTLLQNPDDTGYLTYKTFEQVPNAPGVTNTFPLHWATRLDSDFELMQFAQTNNVLYITNGEDGLFKYDGTRVYRAGMPDTQPLTLTTTGTGLTGSYLYRYYYEFTDAQGGKYKSNLSSPRTVDPNNESVDIEIPTVGNGSGYDTTDPTKLKIVVLRTQAGGSVLYELTRVDNDPTVSSITINDTTSDTALLASGDFTPPVNNPRQPPACRYITVFRNKLIMTGSKVSVNEVFSSDVESPEGFPFSNRFNVRSRFGGPNSAVFGRDNYLYIFKPNSIHILTGSIDTLQFEVDTLSDEGVGCLSANSILESNGRLYFLARQGIYSLFEGQPPKEESDAHKPYYNNPLFTASRVNGFNWIQERVLLWSLPEFDIIDGEKVLNLSRSRIVTLNLTTGAWFTWKGLDISGGISLDQENVWFNGKFVDSENNPVTHNREILNLGTSRDYADHDLAIEWKDSTHWETLQDPSTDKNFNRVRIFSISEPLLDFNNTGFELNVTSGLNYLVEDTTNSTKSFKGGSEGWGNSPWGNFNWGDSPLYAVQFNLARRKCKAIRLTMSNNILHENVLISGYEYEVSIPYRQNIKGNV